MKTATAMLFAMLFSSCGGAGSSEGDHDQAQTPRQVEIRLSLGAQPYGTVSIECGEAWITTHIEAGVPVAVYLDAIARGGLTRFDGVTAAHATPYAAVWTFAGDPGDLALHVSGIGIRAELDTGAGL